MPLPDAVRKQANQADEILKNIQKGDTSEKKDAAPIEPKLPESTVEEIRQEPEVIDYKEKYEKLLDDYNKLKARHDTLQGKYDSEVPRFVSELTAMSSELANTKIELAELKKKIMETPQQSSPVEEEFKKKDEEFQENFPDVYDWVRTYVRREIQNSLNKLREEIVPKFSETEKKIEKTDTETKWMLFTRELTNLVPNWEEINRDPKFMEYLQEIDRYTGYRKYDLLKAANSRYDAKTVAVFFQEFLEREKSNKGNGGEENVAPPKPSITKTEKTSKSGEEPKTFTRAFIRQFYRDAAIGKIPKSEADRIRKEIDKALIAGTIVD